MNSCQFHCKTSSSSQLLCEQCFTQTWTWTYLNKSLRQLIQSISNNSSPNQSKSSSFTVYQMHRTGVSSAGSTEDLIPDFISVKNPKDLGRNEPLLAFQRDYHSLQMKLNIFSALRYEKIAISLPLRSKSHFGKPRINTFISNKFIYSPSQPFIPNIKELADEPSGSNGKPGPPTEHPSPGPVHNRVHWKPAVEPAKDTSPLHYTHRYHKW